MKPELEFSLSEIDIAAQFVLSKTGNARVLAFYGEMGAGKTTLIKAICNQLQVVDEVTSPTFAIIYEYNTKTGKNVYHFDFYRIKDLEEAQNLGCDDYFLSGSYCLIEWPQKIESLLPDEVLKIEIQESEGGKRKLCLFIQE